MVVFNSIKNIKVAFYIRKMRMNMFIGERERFNTMLADFLEELAEHGKI
jgi:hypothetical protein